jgi:hypothetical protein
MKWHDLSSAESGADPDLPAPLLAIAAPLLGLGYFLLLPFVGFTSCLLVGGRRLGLILAAAGRNARRGMLGTQQGWSRK